MSVSTVWAPSAALSALSWAVLHRTTEWRRRQLQSHRVLARHGHDLVLLDKHHPQDGSNVRAMLTSISITRVTVLDQDEALDFYVGKLGFEVTADVDLGFMRWLTIALPDDPDRSLLLEVPGPPSTSEETAGQVRDLLTKGALGVAFIAATDNCQMTYEQLSAKGVEFTEKPTEQPYGIDCALRDPFGNHIRITEPAAQPSEISAEVKDRWAAESTIDQ